MKWYESAAIKYVTHKKFFDAIFQQKTEEKLSSMMKGISLKSFSSAVSINFAAEI